MRGRRRRAHRRRCTQRLYNAHLIICIRPDGTSACVRSEHTHAFGRNIRIRSVETYIYVWIERLSSKVFLNTEDADNADFHGFLYY